MDRLQAIVDSNKDPILSDEEASGRADVLLRLGPAMRAHRRKIKVLWAVIPIIAASALILTWIAATPGRAETGFATDNQGKQVQPTQLGSSTMVIAEPGTKAGYWVVAVQPSNVEVVHNSGVIALRVEQDTRLKLKVAGKNFVATDAIFAVDASKSPAMFNIKRGAVFVASGDQRQVVSSEYFSSEALDYIDSGQLSKASGHLSSKTSSLHASLSSSSHKHDKPTNQPEPRIVATPDSSAHSTSAMSQSRNSAQLWRKARHLRSQGRARDSLKILQTLATRSEPWGPIALAEIIEIARVELKDLELAETTKMNFGRRFPDHELLPD